MVFAELLIVLAFIADVQHNELVLSHNRSAFLFSLAVSANTFLPFVQIFYFSCGLSKDCHGREYHETKY